MLDVPEVFFEVEPRVVQGGGERGEGAAEVAGVRTADVAGVRTADNRRDGSGTPIGSGGGRGGHGI